MKLINLLLSVPARVYAVCAAVIAFFGAFFTVARPALGMAMIATAFALAWAAMTGSAFATGDDITTTITALSGYWDAVEVVAIAVVLFVIGRRIIRKL